MEGAKGFGAGVVREAVSSRTARSSQSQLLLREYLAPGRFVADIARGFKPVVHAVPENLLRIQRLLPCRVLPQFPGADRGCFYLIEQVHPWIPGVACMPGGRRGGK